MKKVLIFGGSGFIATHFLSYVGSGFFLGDYKFVCAQRKQSHVDWCNTLHFDAMKSGQKELRRIVDEVEADYIINFIGAYGSEVDDESLFGLNAMFPERLLDSVIRSRQVKKPKLLLMGSAAEYGESSLLPLNEDSLLAPIGKYGLSKKIQSDIFDYYSRLYCGDFVLARVFNTIGMNMPSSLSIGAFYNKIKLAQSGDIIEVGNLDCKRDFLDIRDVVSAIWEILINGQRGDKYNVCSGSSISMESILECMIAASGKNIFYKKSKNKFLGDIHDSYGSNSKLTGQLGWKQQISIHEAIYSLFKE